jgi:hypothetical protein
MLKTDVLKHFDPEHKSLQATAEALGITKSAVSQWGEVIPEGVAYKLQVMTAGVLRVDPAFYQREEHPRPAA